MRGLSDEFMQDLLSGCLAALHDAIRSDRDLLLEIREDTLNVYFKGHSLLRMNRTARGYSVGLHPKFQVPTIQGLGCLKDKADATQFVQAIPEIKKLIVAHRNSGNEIEYEQMLIRSNNGEARLNTEYFVVDRQVITADRQGRFDLLAIYWPGQHRRAGQTVPLALLELKFSLNNDIKEIHEQLGKYYHSVKKDMPTLAAEAERILQQKIDLGLMAGTPGQLKALKSLRVHREVERVHFGIVLVDYNPASKLLVEDGLANLPFANQIVLFHVGFGLWSSNARKPTVSASA